MHEPEHDKDEDLARDLPPGFRSWRGVYFVVFACFVAYVILLAIFAGVFA